MDETIKRKDQEIRDMKLKVHSTDALLASAGDLHYEITQAQLEENDQTVDISVDQDSKVNDLSNSFTKKQDDSIIEGD